MRWLNEWKNPALKCDRIGHRMGVEYRRGYTRPEDYRYYVCDEVKQTRQVCLRCKINFGEWETKKLRSLTGFSWPTSQVDAFDEKGEYWTDAGFAAAAP